jgi:transcriptional regulator with XRE-family HTH domain
VAKIRNFSEREDTVRRENLLARVLRALSGKSQEQVAEDIGVARSLVAQFEHGEVVPGCEHLAAMARSARLILADAEKILPLCESLRRTRSRPGGSARKVLDRLQAELRDHLEAAYERLLTLPLPGSQPQPADRHKAAEQLARLETLSADLRLVVVEIAPEFHTWALCERVCQASLDAAAEDVEAAAAWARLAEEIAARVRGTKEWRDRLQGYALGHIANVLRASGELAAAEETFEEARRLWCAGADPEGLLDPRRWVAFESPLSPGLTPA